MNLLHLTIALSLGAGSLCAQDASTAPQPANPPPASAATKPAPTPFAAVPSLRGKLNYKPVGRGAPAGRVDAGSRGDGDELASLFVLAPQEVGQTTSAQPTLYWLQTRAVQAPLELSILRPNHPEPLLRIRRERATAAGFQHLSLREYGVSLTPGVEYQWVVALIRDPASRSRDIVSSGWIRHVESPLGNRASAEAYAAQSIWYDAFARLCEQIAARPRDSHLELVRQDLLTQVGLPPLSSKRQD